MNNFNFIAPVYDGIARLFFGEMMQESQQYFLPAIQPTDTVLILGGGTGESLEVMPTCQRIQFVELSENMMKRARKRSVSNEVDFVQADFLKHDFIQTYDVILCPFFLDLFDKNTLNSAIQKMKSMLTKEGRVVITDFQKTKKNGLLLKSMYAGFRLVASIQSRNLPNIQGEVELCGLISEKKKLFHRDMVFSGVYGLGE